MDSKKIKNFNFLTRLNTNGTVTGKGIQKVHMDQKGSNPVEETESVDMVKPPEKQDSNSARPAKDDKRHIPGLKIDEKDNTEVQDGKTSQLEEKESVEITEIPRKQSLLIPEGKSDSDVPDSKIDEEDDTEAQDDKANRSEEKNL